MIDGLNAASSIGELRLKHDAGILGRKESGISFTEAVREKLNQDSTVRFSRHAAQRLAERGTDITDGLLDSLNKAVETARDKGSRDTVIIRGKDAFIVNIPNNVVVTMVSYQDMKENIFTNIDSAVLI